ncbi:MAG: NAD-dependent epimerase/dehydratase family protein [Bacteroidia bacterium]|nr:NAD-dependent epimerase/dehydratase family protein [Bacteroidia bacterium]
MILLTGGTGLLGTHTLLALARKNIAVVAIKRPASDLQTFYYLAEKAGVNLKHITWFDADLLDVNAIYEVTKNINTVIHCGAFVSFAPKQQLLMHKINTDGTANIINACLANNVNRFIHVSSVATLGDGIGAITEENHWITSAYHSQYAISKYGAEREAWRGMAEGMQVVVINPTVILGEGYWNKNGGALIKYAASEKCFYPKGSTGFIDVVDVVNVILFLLENEINGTRFIINGHNTTYKNILDQTAQLFNKKAPALAANYFTTHAAWRLQSIFSILTGTQPLLTKETAISSLSNRLYSNTKMRNSIDVAITPLAETLKRICNCYTAMNQH